MINKILKLIYNKKNRIEGQRIKEKWFLSRNYTKEWKFLKENNIFDVKSLYMYVNNVTDKCECGNEKRFVSYYDGFKKYCERCSRITYNHMKLKNIYIYNNPDTSFNLRPFIFENLYKLKNKNNNNYSSARIKSNNNLVQLIINSTFYLPDDSPINERIYHIENKLFEREKCKKCGGYLDNFVSVQEGYYSEYCKKNNCAMENQDRSKARKSIKLKLYPRLVEKYSKLISDDYEYEMFTEEDYLAGNTIITLTHKKCNHRYSIDYTYQGHLKCPKCYPIRSKVQYEINEFISKYTKTKYNDRQLIKPLEIDILTETFGVEYDSLNFHSTGKSDIKMLNNTFEEPKKHLIKTEMCESKGIHLYHIFSNEWHYKQNIWKSVLSSKLGTNKRIYARKCVIKVVNKQEKDIFLENNHLQGSCISSINLGLYDNDEIVQIMTFSKSRFSKKYEYELIRLCSILNANVVGGASKLLKHFERNYSPKSLVSYANRRWSQGNVYEKLGFTFSHNSAPGFFYFKGQDNSKLLSRIQFQKHKLKDKLEHYNEKLSVTENMYNHKFRKIYDCGNKVFFKVYK